MRRLFGFLVVLAIIVGLVGLWRGWWTVTVDKDKINQDEQTAKQKLDQVKDNFQKKDSTPAAPK